jgi:DMSO/TMAO reductase YedYZ molybdopterin-dependent catalytic subunit
MTMRTCERTITILWLAALGSLGWTSASMAQEAAHPVAHAAAGGTIQISGDVPHPVTLSAADIQAMPHHTVRASEHGLPESAYEGVALSDVLGRAGVAFGPALHGPALATYVMCSAADGYRVVFTLAELDSAFSDRPVFLVDRKDGQSLDAHTGPFRIVVPGDARPARWIRQLTQIAVVRPNP